MIWAGQASCLVNGSGAQACVALSPGTDSEVRVHAWGQRRPQVFSSQWEKWKPLVLTLPGLWISGFQVP